MLSRAQQPPLSDAAIRQFLLGRTRGNDQAAFERALFLDSRLEQRTRLEEIALADDYARGRLRGKDVRAFVEKFPFSTARRNQIEVSIALNGCFAPAMDTHRTEELLTFKHPVWKLAFATMILIMLFATIWLVTKEARVVQRFVPHRSSPGAVTTPTPQPAHHAERASEPATHTHDQQMTPQGHELSNDVVVLDSTTTAQNAATVTLATIRDQTARIQLLLGESASSSYLAELINSNGELVFNEVEIPVDANADRVNFNIPIEHLDAGDFQIRLTRTSDGKQVTYFLRVR
jgi:hypothetical protein